MEIEFLKQTNKPRKTTDCRTISASRPLRQQNIWMTNPPTIRQFSIYNNIAFHRILLSRNIIMFSNERGIGAFFLVLSLQLFVLLVHKERTRHNRLFCVHSPPRDRFCLCVCVCCCRCQFLQWQAHNVHRHTRSYLIYCRSVCWFIHSKCSNHFFEKWNKIKKNELL